MNKPQCARVKSALCSPWPTDLGPQIFASRRTEKSLPKVTSTKVKLDGAGALRTRRQNLETRESAILNAARQLFSDRGFDGATMTDIAHAAGVAEGTVYLYFSNKKSLATAVFDKFYDELTEGAQNGVAKYGTTADKLSFLAKHHLENILKERAILALLDRDAAYDLNKRYVSVFDNVVRHGVQLGDIDSSFDVWVLRDIFYGGLEYAMRTIILTGRKGATSQMVSQLIKIIVKDDAIAPASDGAVELSERMEDILERMEACLPPKKSLKKRSQK